MAFCPNYATSPEHAAFPIPTPPVLHPLCHPPPQCWSQFCPALSPPRSPSAERRIRRPNRRRRARTMRATSCTRTRPRTPGAFSGPVSAYGRWKGWSSTLRRASGMLGENNGGFGTGVADVASARDRRGGRWEANSNSAAGKRSRVTLEQYLCIDRPVFSLAFRGYAALASSPGTFVDTWKSIPYWEGGNAAQDTYASLRS
ncbi:hypothetical protein C8F01DRAFT_270435 [Mycena amicta]|nr:hypothetical protein C8F01DRAFT_270435 [Mycena amicta]